MRPLSPATRSAGATAALALGLAAVLAACGGGTSKASTAKSSNTTTPGSGAPASGSGGGPASIPGASGSVAAITGSSMEVQNPSSGQTTVNWTGTTTFDQTVTLTASGVTAGDCVTVTGASSGGQITARSVSVSPAPSSGTCSTAFGGGRRVFGGSGSGGNRPSGTAPGSGSTGSSVPGRFRTGGGFPNGGGGFANGKVVSVSPTSMVIYGTSFNGFPAGTSTSTPPTTAAPADITVALTSSTTFTEVKAATASNLAVGDCVTATGPSDSTGAVTARTIRITSTGGQACPTGFGRFGGGGAGAGAAPAASANAQ